MCLINSALKERYTKASEGFEMFSLLLSLFKDITHFGDQKGFIENMLEEVIRILNARRASIFLINPETNELEAIAALGMNIDDLKFDYRRGIAGSVFTTGVALNIDIENDSFHFNDEFDMRHDFKTTSIVCYPIHNREDKIVGVIQVLNKRNQDRFTIEDEKTMKVLALLFSSVFHKFSPVSESSLIRNFSTPFDREHALIGGSSQVQELRSTIIKIKDLDYPLLIEGEQGVGKTLFSKIIHYEGKRGLEPFGIIDCSQDSEYLEKVIFGKESVLETSKGGTVVFRHINLMPIVIQNRLYEAFMNGRLPDSQLSIDIRTIFTTSADVLAMAIDGSFHLELSKYMTKTYINMPSLRSRFQDIEELVNYFLKIECKKQGYLLKRINEKAMKKFINYDWPGNIQELKGCIERAVIYNPKTHIISNVDMTNNILPLGDLSSKKRTFGEIPHVANFNLPLKDRVLLVERLMIVEEIKRHNGNKSKAATAMKISREALRKKMLQSDKVIVNIEEKKKAA